MAIYINWTGHSGHIYTFETHPIGTAFKQIGGVYIFCKPASKGDWDALYVGETGNFDERLNTALQRHQAWPTCRMLQASHVGVMIVSGALARLSIETDLRHSLRPPANRQSA